MTISELPEGTRCRLGEEAPYRFATILHHGDSGTRVQFEGTVTRSFTDNRTGQLVTFTKAALPPTTISGGAPAEAL